MGKMNGKDKNSCRHRYAFALNLGARVIAHAQKRPSNNA